MKKLSLVAILILGVFSLLTAQERKRYEYCQANVSTGFFSSIVQFDGAEGLPFKLNWNNYIVDENGKYLKVKSAAEFINIMSKYDWEFVDFFEATHNQSTINILFRRALKFTGGEPGSETMKQKGG